MKKQQTYWSNIITKERLKGYFSTDYLIVYQVAKNSIVTIVEPLDHFRPFKFKYEAEWWKKMLNQEKFTKLRVVRKSQIKFKGK